MARRVGEKGWGYLSDLVVSPSQINKLNTISRSVFEAPNAATSAAVPP